jgi:pimeloyl-ACP methyl ester carboxylesterase
VKAAPPLAVGANFSHAQPSLPSSFQAKTIHSPEGADIFVRWGGKGPVVVLLHGYAENSDSWAPLAADLMKDHTVVVPDLRGIGRSSKPADGYDKKTQAKDIRAVVTALGYDKTSVVAHDIGNTVAYAYAATYPDKVERLVVMDAPIPGIGPWNEVLLIPAVWHFNFHGPDAERLVASRERIYLDRIWNDFTGDPSKPDEATRNFYAATYAQPGGMRAGFAQFTAFSQDAKDNKIFQQTKLTMPVLAVGGEKSFGPLQAVIMRYVATNVQEAVVAGSGHWLMEERPAETVALLRSFLDAASSAGGSGEERLSPSIRFPVAESRTEIAIVTANCWYRRPVMPGIKAVGTNTADRTNAIPTTGPESSCIAFRAASLGAKPSSMWRDCGERFREKVTKWPNSYLCES